MLTTYSKHSRKIDFQIELTALMHNIFASRHSDDKIIVRILMSNITFLRSPLLISQLV